ncbi:MAG: dihydroneopterin aldolase [Candidatus Heimdallarchaeota archaeon]|nr:dihydroneopterin aldolase [Candidatus Heimdallarchaeota archaeon]
MNRADKIIIKDLLLRGIIGINEWERNVKQDILVNIVLTIDLTNAGKTDSVDDTLNYRSLNKELIQLVENSSFYLVEKLATSIADLCLTNQRVDSVRVRVEKPMALRFAKSVGVEIERGRK